jgi:hypothetical protein
MKMMDDRKPQLEPVPGGSEVMLGGLILIAATLGGFVAGLLAGFLGRAG